MGRPSSSSSTSSSEPPPPSAQAESAKEIDNSYHCRFCNSSWPNATSLTRHEIIHRDESDRPYTCGICGKGFSQKTAFQTHQNTHTGLRPHRCRVIGCTSTFGDPSSRTRHEKETHDPSFGFKCVKCGDTTKRKDQFKKHTSNTHHDKATEKVCESARNYYAKAYWATLEAEGGTAPVQTNQPTQPAVKVDEGDLSPPPRSRRNAMALTSQVVPNPPQEYEESRISPLSSDHSYFDATNHARTDSIESANGRPGQYFENARDGTLVETLSRAYTPRYDQAGQFYPSDHTLRCPASRSGTPEQGSISSVAQEASEALLRYMRDPYRVPIMARGYSISSPQVSMPSPHVPVSSPRVAMPVPRVPLPTEQSLFAQHNWSSPGPYWSPDEVDVMSRLPRSMHPSVLSRDHLQESRHHPYGRLGRRGHAAEDRAE